MTVSLHAARIDRCRLTYAVVDKMVEVCTTFIMGPFSLQVTIKAMKTPMTGEILEILQKFANVILLIFIYIDVISDVFCHGGRVCNVR